MARGDLATTATTTAIMGNSTSSHPVQNHSEPESDSSDIYTISTEALNRMISVQSRAELSAILDSLFNEHEQPLKEQLAQQKNILAKLLSENGKYRKAYRELRDQRRELQEQKETFRKQSEGFQQQLQEQKTVFKKQSEGYQQQLQDLEVSKEHNRTRYKWLVRKIILPYAQSRNLQWNEQTGETIDVLVEPLIADALEATDLRKQKGALQKKLLAGVEKGEAMTDEYFTQEFRILAALIKSLSRSVRLKSGVDVMNALSSGILVDDITVQHWDSRVQKKYLIEAWTWSVLLNLVFRGPFIMFGDKAETLTKLWPVLFNTTPGQDWPPPSTVCETWRYTTMERLVGGIVNSKIITQQMTKDKPNHLEQSLIDTRKHVFEVIETAIEAVSTQVDVCELHQIVDKAFALTMHMSFQRARFQVTYPEAGEKFNEQSMRAVPDLNGEEPNKGIVALVVNPGLTKWGDAHGKNLDHHCDIIASLVQLESAHEKRAERKIEHDHVFSLTRNYGVAVPRPEDMKVARGDRESQR